MSQGGHSGPLLLLALFYQSTPSCLKVMGGGGGGVGGVGGPCDFSVSPWSKSFFFPLFNLGAYWDRGPDLDLDQGLTIMFIQFRKI